MQKFYSNGKLLLSGEYAILDGALGWAVPTKFGQHLCIQKNETSNLIWKSRDEAEKSWFEGVYGLEKFEELNSSNRKTSQMLMKILFEVRLLNPLFLASQQGHTVETSLTFKKDWGLGSSSTLINNIAQWANVDAYQLLKKTFGGSGYDIACAQHDSPILYRFDKGLPIVTELGHQLPFASSLYFVYLNKKQNSREGIADYQKRTKDAALIEQISKLTQRMSECSDVKVFGQLMVQHEKLISKTLEILPVKVKLFPDYFGEIKSLGAWGGDFVLATGNEDTPMYFKKKGYETIIPYSQMVLP